MITAAPSNFWFVRANRGSDWQSDFLRLQCVQYTRQASIPLWDMLKCGGFFLSNKAKAKIDTFPGKSINLRMNCYFLIILEKRPCPKPASLLREAFRGAL